MIVPLPVLCVSLAVLCLPLVANGKSGGGANAGHSGQSQGSGYAGRGSNAASGLMRSGPASGVSGGGHAINGSTQADSRYRNMPPPDPSRRVDEQDCSKPIELEGGNLKCK